MTVSITTSTNRVKELTIKNDVIEKSRGSWIIRSYPIGIKTMLRSFNQFIPYLNRIINDYDAENGEY